MKRMFRSFAWVSLAMLVLVIAAIVAITAVAANVGTAGSFDSAVIRFDDGGLTLLTPGPLEWIGIACSIGAALLVALVVAAVILPQAVLLPLLLVVMALGGAGLVLVGAVALFCSPLLVIVGVTWLWRRSAMSPRCTFESGEPARECLVNNPSH